MPVINYNSEDLDKLKAIYDSAVKEGKEVVIYNGNEYLVKYLKYLIEYLELFLPR